MDLQEKVFLIDLDGTMYRGGQPIAGAKDFIERLIEDNIPFMFVTNNAMRKHQAAADNLNKITGLNVECKHFYTSVDRSEEHTSELQSRFDLVCRLLL